MHQANAPGRRQERQQWQAQTRPFRVCDISQTFRLPGQIDHITAYASKPSLHTHRLHIPTPSRRLNPTNKRIRKDSKSSFIDLPSAQSYQPTRRLPCHQLRSTSISQQTRNQDIKWPCADDNLLELRGIQGRGSLGNVNFPFVVSGFVWRGSTG